MVGPGTQGVRLGQEVWWLMSRWEAVISHLSRGFDTCVEMSWVSGKLLNWKLGAIGDISWFKSL